MLPFLDKVARFFRRGPQVTFEGQEPGGPHRGSVDLIVILDGTLSSLEEGEVSNAGFAFKLLSERVPGLRRKIYYEPGLQWEHWRKATDIAFGRGINRQIRRAYGWLASNYRPGDRIFLMGYSRGAYAVRSLGGVIDRIGLLRSDVATERNVVMAYRHYQTQPESEVAQAFSKANCHTGVGIEMVGVWDTVKALGLRVPLLWLFTEDAHAFHNHQLGPHIRHGFQALALNETRAAFDPVLWECPPGWTGHVEQVWFRGAHADIGGQIGSFQVARPLANIPFVWMMEKAQVCGLVLPEGWRERFPCDPSAPMVGTWQRWGKFFLMRHRRRVLRDPSESLHPTVPQQETRRWKGAMVARTE